MEFIQGEIVLFKKFTNPKIKKIIVCNVSRSNKEKCGKILWYYMQNR
jgi:hypothetical protein